jgi:dTDP-4-amino-4,6-dideoxygalactose transaminase
MFEEMNVLNWKIPLFNLNFDSEEEKAVLEVLKSKWVSMGEKTAEFEESFKHLIGVKHAIAVTNCTAALHLALRILNIKKGDEVIVPSLTFVATVNAVRYVQATPVFADVTSFEDLTISPEEIEKKITPNTKAIITMHYGGFACNMGRIMEIAKRHGLYVIEDAAHAPGATYKGNKIGSFGDVAAFSFFANKNLTTAEGGMLTTNNDELANKAILLRSHGMTSVSYDRFKGHATTYDVLELGYNYRLDDIRAALGIVQLKKLHVDIQKRKELVRRYYNNLKNQTNVIIPFQGREQESTNYIFPIVLSPKCSLTRDEVRRKLANVGIQTSVHYPAVHEFSFYKSDDVKLEITEYVARNEITLPLYGSMTFDDVDYVSKNIESILGD